jgi:hypothetical protein
MKTPTTLRPPTSLAPQKSPSSKARKVGRVTPCAPPTGGAIIPARRRRHQTKRLVRSLAPPSGGQRTTCPAIQPPTALERDTLLTPEWIAESVVQETERFLKAALPEGFAERLAARAYYLYPRHRHFHKMLNRPGDFGRHNLGVYMRHWTAGWLKRERNPLHKKLPYSFGMGRRLPV